MRNAYTGDKQVVSYGCGKCWNCIHSFRESWRIRLYESMVASGYSKYKGFIYDTLTLAPSSMPSYSAYDYFTGEFAFPEFYDCEKVMKVIDHYGGRLPYLPKSTVSLWIKRCRENYNSHYRKQIKAGTMQRCQIRIFAALEYGPLWSRPHVHLAAFGISRADYVRFFAKVWRRDMGFTKTKWVDLRDKGKEFQSHCSRVSTYISKYLLKGSYESVLVRAGLVPKAWRVVSHGIGAEYLDNDFAGNFSWLQDDIKFQMGCRISVDSNKNDEKYQDIVQYCNQKYLHLSTEQVNSLKTYVKNGYHSALPRYYRDRVLHTHNKALAGCAIKAALLENAEHDSFEKILQYASDCCFFPGVSGEGLRYLLEHDLRAFNFAAYRFDAFKRNEAIRKSEWHRISTLNTLKRVRAKPTTGDLGLIL